MNKIILYCLLLLMGSSALSACARENTASPPIHRTQFLMGTLVEITASHSDPEVVQKATTQAFEEMRRIEGLMSTYIPDSEISRLNRSAGGEGIRVSPEVAMVIREGIRWGEASHGAFDISIEPVVKLWDFDGGANRVPSPEDLAEAVRRVDYRKIQLDNGVARLPEAGMAINVGGIAKGYAVDRAIAILRAQVPNAIINAGGDLMAYGRRDPQHPWIIGLQHPRKPQDLLASFALTDRAVATSGDYQRYFIQNGKRYHHILNPKTGMPVQGVTSVSILAPTVMEADALATAVFVLGPESGLAWVETMPEVEALVVLEGGSHRITPGFEALPQFQIR